MKISYAVPVCNEHQELKRLLDFLLQHKREKDEIIVQCDQGNTTSEVYEVLMSYENTFKIIEYPLNNNFATFKNNLKENCTGDYIFQIDADECPDEHLIGILPSVIENNEVDIVWVPRINLVEGLTTEYIQKWGWKVDDKDRVNFPDYQCRILKNTQDIKWKNKVHEILEGYKNYAHLPAEEAMSLYHSKTLDKQLSQVKHYQTIDNKVKEKI